MHAICVPPQAIFGENSDALHYVLIWDLGGNNSSDSMIIGQSFFDEFCRKLLVKVKGFLATFSG